MKRTHHFFLFAILAAGLVSAASGIIRGQESQNAPSASISGIVQVADQEFAFRTLSELQAIVGRLQAKAESKGHIPNYVELSALDIAKTKDFYGKALGFEFVDYGPQYTATSQGPIALGFTLSEQTTAAVLAIQSHDIEKSLEQVKRAGGKIEKPLFQFPGGRRFEFRDPSGNHIAIFENQR